MTSAGTTDGPVSPVEWSRALLLRRFWRNARGFWSGEGSRFTWIVTVSLTFVVFVSPAITYGINLRNRYFFDAPGRKMQLRHFVSAAVSADRRRLPRAVCVRAIGAHG